MVVFDRFPDDLEYRVVINHEEQYSIWPADRSLPRGWKDSGVAGTKRLCLEHIEEVWTDMRPLLLHREMLDRIRRGK